MYGKREPMRIAAASLGTPSTIGAAGYHSVSLASSVCERNAGVRLCDELRGNRRDLIKTDSSVGIPQNVKLSCLGKRVIWLPLQPGNCGSRLPSNLATLAQFRTTENRGGYDRRFQR